MALIQNRFMALGSVATDAGELPVADLDRNRLCMMIWAPATSPQAAALRREHEWLQHLAAPDSIPEVVGWEAGHAAEPTRLILAPPEGVPLLKVVTDDGTVHPRSGRTAARWARSLARRVQQLRSSGAQVTPSLDPRWLVVTPHGEIAFARLIPGPGEADESQQVRQIAHLIYLLATGHVFDASLPWRCRPADKVNLTVSASLAELLEGVLRGDTCGLAELDAQLTTHLRERTPQPRAYRESAQAWEALAGRAADQLAMTVERSPTTDYTLYKGLPGQLLMLLAAADGLGSRSWDAAIAQAAQDLEDAPAPGDYADSLYLGQAGVAFALLKAGAYLGQPKWVEQGVALAARVHALPYRDADLVWGAAGRLRFQLWLATLTGAREDWAAAQATGAWLIESATGGSLWPSVRGDRGSYLGYAHGSAGIGDALLDLYLEVPTLDVWDVILRIAERLRTQAVAQDSPYSQNWPKSTTNAHYLTWWCHGATGIAPFLLRFGQVAGAAWAVELAQRGLTTVAERSGGLSPCICHGLSGSIEALLDEATVQPAAARWDDIYRLWGLLDDYRLTHPTGAISWRNHHHQPDDPALMTGYGGVIHTLLRLAEPARPRLLSLDGMRYACRTPLRDQPYTATTAHDLPP